MPMRHKPNFIMSPSIPRSIYTNCLPILGAGRTGLNVLYMPSFVQSMSITTGITRKAGDRLRVYGTGYPTPASPSPTKLSLFATALDGGSEALISMESLVMTPVFDGSDAPSSIAHRDLCYKLQWEPFPVQVDTEMDMGLPLTSSSAKRNRNDSESDTGAEAQREKRRKGHNGEFVSDGIKNHSEHLKSNGASRCSMLQVAIICDESTQSSLVSNITDLLSDFTRQTPTVGSLATVPTEGKICIVLSELATEVISNLTAADFQAIQKISSSAAGVLWVIQEPIPILRTPMDKWWSEWLGVFAQRLYSNSPRWI